VAFVAFLSLLASCTNHETPTPIGTGATASRTGPAVTAACPLLSADSVATVLGWPTPQTAEGDGNDQYQCTYTADSNNSLSLGYTEGLAGGRSAETLVKSMGDQPVSGLGGAARYQFIDGRALGHSYATLDIAVVEGPQARLIELRLTTTSPSDPKEKLVTLARSVLTRV
jgi:hypothetical protein